MKDKNNKIIKILEKQMFSKNLEAQSPSHYGLNLAWVILMSDIAEFNKSRAPLFINLDIPDIKHLERCLEIILRKLLETRKYQTQFSKRSPSYEDRRDDAQARPNKKSIDFLCMPCKNYAKKELRNSKK